MKKLAYFTILSVLLTPIYLSLAQTQPPIQQPVESSPLIEQGVEYTIRSLFSLVFRILTIIAGVLAVIMFMIAGINYIVYPHKEDKQKAAKAYLIWGTIGLIVALISYAVVVLIHRFVTTAQ